MRGGRWVQARMEVSGGGGTSRRVAPRRCLQPGPIGQSTRTSERSKRGVRNEKEREQSEDKKKTYVEKLQQVRVAVVDAAVTKDHLRRQRVREAADVQQQVRRLVQQRLQQKFVLEVLVRHVRRGRFHVQNVVHHLVDHAPVVTVAHDHQPQTATGNSLPDEHVRPVRIDAAPSVQDLLDGHVRREHDHCLGAEHERVDGSVLLCPLLELQMRVFGGHQMQIAEQRQCRRARREVARPATDLGQLGYKQHQQATCGEVQERDRIKDAHCRVGG